MKVTAILMLLLLICLIVSERKDFKGLSPFNKTTTLPLRGFLALLIISHHLGQRTDIYLLSQFTTKVGIIIVAIFFFISGYGLCASYLAKGESYLNGFIQKRMGKLLPKFIFLTIVMVFGYHIFTSLNITAQALMFTTGWVPLPFSWFIYAIIYVYLAFLLCALISKSPKRTGILLTVATVTYIGVFRIILHFPYYWFITIICVNAGYFVALYESQINKLFNHRLALFPTLAALLFISLCAKYIIRLTGATFALTEIWILIQVVSVYAIIRTLGFFQWRWLCYIGGFSLELYLIHGIPLKIGQHLGLDNWSLWIWTYALSLPSAILLNRAYDLMFNRKADRPLTPSQP